MTKSKRLSPVHVELRAWTSLKPTPKTGAVLSMVSLMNDFRIRLVLLLVFLLSLSACTSPSFSPGPNSEYIALSAEDVINVLTAAGLSEDKIVSEGREFRNILAGSGSAMLKDGNATIAMITVKSGLVHISTINRGSFIYNPRTKELR
jgi:hypothetical protein